MADNRLCNKEAGKALATMLAGNTTLKEFDVSKNSYAGCDGPGFAQEFADGIRNNGAMKKLTISGDHSRAKPVTIETSMTEADFSDKLLGTSGATMLAAFLPKCR